MTNFKEVQEILSDTVHQLTDSVELLLDSQVQNKIDELAWAICRKLNSPLPEKKEKVKTVEQRRFGW